jgi:signal peptidase I
MFVFRYVSVEGESMLDTLNDSDKLIISNLAYTPQTGDIVVVKHDSRIKPLIKRIIATEGQTVEIDYINWSIYVDGVLLDEDYVKREDGPMRFGDKYPEPFTVGEGMVFVMGDNRNNSQDSRYFGEFPKKSILGRVIYRVFPIKDFGKVR